MTDKPKFSAGEKAYPSDASAGLTLGKGYEVLGVRKDGKAIYITDDNEVSKAWNPDFFNRSPEQGG